MTIQSYLNFDLTLSEIAGRYQVEVTHCPIGGQAARDFSLPVSGQQLEHFILNTSRSRGHDRSLAIDQPPLPDVAALGKALFASLFEDEVEGLFLASLKEAEDQGKGLRINLRFSDAPGLIGIPWELLTNTTTANPFVLSVETPIVRKLNLGSASRVRQSADALRVLVMISNPAGSQPLDVEAEWRRLDTATRSLQAEGKVILERVEPSLPALQKRLENRQADYDVFHYIGHGGFDSQTREGVLLLEDAQRREHLVDGQELGSLLYDEKIQLVVLNSCNGARSSLADPFAGVGQSLLRKRIPAVVAMQFEISDQAAIAFSGSFYAVLVKGYKVEAAVAAARKAIYAQDQSFEWATPVLYTSTDEVSFLTNQPTPSPAENTVSMPPTAPRVHGKLLANTQVQQRGASRQLAVVVHGWMMGVASIGDVTSTIGKALPDADLLVPAYPAGVFSNANPVRITEELNTAIQNACKARRNQTIEADDQGYEEIILVGHSLGALLVRKALLFAMGQTQDNERAIPFDTEPWAGKVSRIILMSGMNRGWSLEKQARDLSPLHWYGFSVGVFLYRWTRIGKLFNHMRQGSPFIANLRIQWLNLIRANHVLPPTIQLLGDRDDIVSEEDNVDLQSGAGFIYKNVPNTGHGDVVRLLAEPARLEAFQDALLTSVEKLKSDFCPPLQVDNDVSSVVFIMHGLRDYGHWTDALGEQIERLGKAKGVNVKAIKASYGYFPMLHFLLQPERQEQVRWFADRYTEAMAQYPKARICFVGHSNGTYLLASALRRYAAMKFHDIVLTGSIVPYVYPWDKAARENRVTRIRNYVASRDWLVAILPAVFEDFSKDPEIGSSGLNGFQQDTGRRFTVEYVKGGHYAAIAPENHDAIARFILGEEVPKEEHNPALITARQHDPTVLANRLSRLIWLVLLVALGMLLFGPAVAWFLGHWNPETIALADTVHWWMPPVLGPLIFSVLVRLV